jgi:hypothetical protein
VLTLSRRIQYLRHLHEKVKKLTDKSDPKEQNADIAAAQSIMNPGMGMMMGYDQPLMIGYGGGDYGGGAQAYGGGVGDIPNPYQQPAYGYGYNGGNGSGYY